MPLTAPLDVSELLEEALAIPSPSGEEGEVAAYLVSRMSEFAREAFIDEAGNAVARLGHGPRRLTFLGHIDTVPGVVPVRVEGGCLYGRGAVDAKGPMCTAIAAASRLTSDDLAGLSLTLIGAVEEEVPSSKGARHALSAYPPPDLLVIGEPSGWDAITLGYKGRLVVSVQVGKGNHHSAGSESSAPEDAVALWSRVERWAAEYNQGRERIFERVQATLQEIVSWADGMEQNCRAVIGLRLPPALPPRRARSELRVLLEGSEFSFGGSEEPYRGPRDTTLTRFFRRAIREQGGNPRFKLKTGTSDMNVVAPCWTAPVVAYGPGDSALDHTPDEHVELAELDRATAVLTEVFSELGRSVGQSPESS